ncbi:MAG TPA: winged helix-turn-helix transcriptional regulator [Pseudonocardiaceae bacterium]|nr:winged helix-turn-helix transcriptional regulator [Pseudonocardiaceae bacterium]
MTRNVRTYDHFCLVARALEQVGERWSLLVVRDLLTGPKRFTDLMDRLGGITPKTLSQRLRELAEVGVVAVDREPGRREVWYQLTEAGRELDPVVDALAGWGMRHAWRWPLPGEPVHIEHVLGALTQAIEHATDEHEQARWHLRFPGDEYLLECDGRHWSLTSTTSTTEADVTVTAPTDAFIQFLVGRVDATDPRIDVVGEPDAVQRFERLVKAFAEVTRRSA